MTKNYIEELENEIKERATEYYSGIPSITDNEFDALVEELKSIDPTNALLKTPGWGYVPTKNKIKHIIEMGSLDKIHNIEDFKSDSIIASLKLDGLSCEIVYNNGYLIRASTRGNGKIGVVVTKNLIHAIPTKINIKDQVVIRGEVVLPQESFEKMNDAGISPRNKASGLLMSLAYNDDIKYLKFIPFDVFINNQQLAGISKYEWLDSYYPNTRVNYIISTPKNLLQDWENKSMNTFIIDGQKYTIPSDGIVIEDIHGIEKTKAYKFEDVVVKTKVTDITWNVSGNGRMIPIIHLEPVIIEDANITKCTGNNVKWILDNKIGIGSSVEIVRANMVIPKIVNVLTSGVLTIPGECPLCGTLLKTEGVHIVCANEICKSKLYHYFNKLMTYYCEEGLGQKTTDKLLDILINDEKFYDFSHFMLVLDEKIRKITPKYLSNYFGPATIKLIYNTINNYVNNEIDLVSLCLILDIPGLGETLLNKIQNKLKHDILYCIEHKQWNNLIEAADNHKMVKESLSNPTYQSKIYTFVILKQDKIHIHVNDETSNKIKVAITGRLQNLTKSQWYEKWKEKVIKYDVKEGLDYLIADESSNSSKYKKAKKLNVRIVTLEEMETILSN